MDEFGHPLTEVKFDKIGNFYDGYAVYSIGGKCGVFSESANIIIDEQFDAILLDGELDCGIPAKKGNKWGYINLCGDFIVRPDFIEVTPFTDSMAAVFLSSGRWRYIDKSANAHFECGPQDVYQFSFGRKRIDKEAGFEFVKAGKYGYCDKNGTIVIPPVFIYAAEEFSENRSSVQSSNTKYGIIDVNGSYVVDPMYTWIGHYSDGRAVARIDDNDWEVLDLDGRVVWSCAAIDVSSPRCGYIKKKFISGLCGLLDVDGKEIISDSFFDISYWSKDSGIATVQGVNGKYGAVDIKNGKQIIDCIYESDFHFDGNLAYIQLRDGEGYINRTGKLVYLFN